MCIYQALMCQDGADALYTIISFETLNSPMQIACLLDLCYQNLSDTFNEYCRLSSWGKSFIHSALGIAHQT